MSYQEVCLTVIGLGARTMSPDVILIILSILGSGEHDWYLLR